MSPRMWRILVESSLTDKRKSKNWCCGKGIDLLMKEDARDHSDSFCVQEGIKTFVLREITRHGGAEPPDIFAAGVSADISNLVAKSRASGKANQVGRSWVRHFINWLELESSKREIKEERTGLARPPRCQRHDDAKLNGTQTSASIGPQEGEFGGAQVGCAFNHLCHMERADVEPG